MIGSDLLYFALAAGQGGLLYLLHRLIEGQGASLWWMLPLYSLLLALPTTVFLLRERFGEPALPCAGAWPVWPYGWP